MPGSTRSALPLDASASAGRSPPRVSARTPTTTIAQDAVDDAAINNSPRLPSKPEILEILAQVS